MNEYTVTVAFDDEAQKWYAQNDDIPIMLEDGSIDALISRVKLAAPEMLEINDMPHEGVHLVFKMETKCSVFSQCPNNEKDRTLAVMA